MENGQGAVRVRALFSNITALGPGNYTIGKVRVDIPSLRLDLHLSIPKIELAGRYEVAGNVLLFPIQSQGDFWALFGMFCIDEYFNNVSSLIFPIVEFTISLSVQVTWRQSLESKVLKKSGTVFVI